MSPEFKSFLQGLLNKTPSEWLSWPDLLHHPFIKETDQEKKDRKVRTDLYNKWAAWEHPTGGRDDMKDILDNNLFSNEQSNSTEEKNDQFDK